MKSNDVVGLGNALMDFLIELDDHQFQEFNLTKGEMHLVDAAQAARILAVMDKSKACIEMVPGGSVANTLKGIAFLGGKTILCGKVGNDAQGVAYVQEMERYGVKAKITQHPTHSTGHAIGFITPDAQRTFSVHLGAAIHLAKEDVVEDDIAQSRILHLEGYQLEGNTADAVLHAIDLAHKHETVISLDLADPGLIRRHKKLLQDVLKRGVDIVFVNEHEAKEFTGKDPELAAIELGTMVKIAVVKLGSKGSIVIGDGQLHYIAPFPAKAIDTTGAGDTYAAGFLYGYIHGWDLAKAGKFGSLFASKVVEQKGVRLKEIDGEKLKERIMC